MTPVNFSINLCDVLGGLLCPLPQYNFSGWDSVPLPQALGVSNRIPGIAFKVPDLEAFTQLKLIEVGTGNVKACVQATLSNGWSTFQPAVQWVTGGVAIFAFVIAAWQSLMADSVLSFHFLDLFAFYQTIAASSLLNLNYSSVYRAFTLNFAWAMGLLPSPALQNAIDRMRHLTGGTLANSSSNSAVGFVNRELSPFNQDFSNLLIDSPASSRVLSTWLNLASPLSDTTPLNILSATSQVQTVTANSSNVLQAGIPIYVNSVHIATANAFMTLFLCVLILVAIALAIFFLGYICLFAMESFHWGNQNRCVELRYTYRSFFRAWLLRLVCLHQSLLFAYHELQSLIVFFPTAIFVFYQWTLRDSWLSVLLSVIFVLGVFACIVFSAYRTIHLARSATPYALYSHPNHLTNYGPLYARYRISRYYYFTITLSSSLLKAIFIAFVRVSGLAQIILMLIVELACIVSLFVLRPYKTKGNQAFSIFLSIIRLVCTGMLIAFVESLQVKAITRTIVGIVIAIIYSVGVLAVILNLFVAIVWNCICYLRTSSSAGSTAVHTDEIALEKGDEKDETLSESSRIIRPRNPTPEHNVPMDPQTKQVYPATPTATDISTSASTNFGSVILPRRWTFTPLHSPVSSAAEIDEGSRSSEMLSHIHIHNGSHPSTS